MPGQLEARVHVILFGPTALEAERKALAEDPAVTPLAAAIRRSTVWNHAAAQASIRDWPDAARRVLAESVLTTTNKGATWTR